MSALGGIYYFDDTPVDQDILISLGQRLGSHGPDGGREVVSGSVGIAYRAFHTTRESRLEQQPLVSPGGHIIAWDGRLDNRDELLALLRNELDADQTDVAIVMSAYLKLGIDFLPRLIGDFALSLWNPKTRTLLLARDPIGPRPLYYHADADRVIWSSELMPLLDFAEIALEINDEYVAGYITRGAAPELTPYKNIYAVSPGHVAIVRNGHISEQSFWGLDPSHEIRYKTDKEYEEHFYHLFKEAVRCRLRVQGPVWATLSGGFDSSAIVCMADEILKGGEADASKLETVSFVYDEATSSDERKFISCVEEQRKQSGHHLLDADYPPLALFPDEDQLDFPDFLDCFRDLNSGLCRSMSAAGARVLLTGHGGDEMLCSNPSPSPELGDLLVQRQLLRLHHSIQTWSVALKRPYLELLVRDCIMPFLPPSIQIAFGLKAHAKLPPWFDANFVNRMRLRERHLRLTDVFDFKLPSGRDQALGFLSVIRMTSKAAYRARGHIEVSHPYLHRPLVEFMQAIPHEQRVRPGETRSLMRRALIGSLPEKILKRKGKKGPEEALFRAIARQWPRLQPIIENARVCAYGYMNSQSLMRAFERARHGCEPHSFALIQTISLEFWLRALERRGSVARSILAEGLKAPSAAVLSSPTQAVNQCGIHQGMF